MPVEKLVIGVSGRPRAGKTTVCDFLVSKYGFQHLEISSLVIADVRQWMKGKDVNLDEFNKEEYRLILQGWGSFARIALGETYWIDQIMNSVVTPAIIGGIRYPVEIEQIHNRDGKVIRVTRGSAGNADTAATETQLDSYQNFDAIVENNGTYDDLYAKVAQLIDRWSK